MKELPNYFVIKLEEKNPLWKNYIEWLRKTLDLSIAGNTNKYYGLRDGELIFSDKTYKATIITLKEWDNIVNPKEFILPDQWCVCPIDEESDKILCQWRRGCHTDSWSNSELSYHKMWYHKGHSGYPEITFEQFKKYVLKEKEIMKEIIGYKAPYDINNKVRKGTIYIKETTNYCPTGKEGQGSEWYLPPQIVEKWEPIYKEDGKTFYFKFHKVEVAVGRVKIEERDYSVSEIENLLFHLLTNFTFMAYEVIFEEDAMFKIGCKRFSIKEARELSTYLKTL
jgi:hypothetical protein